MYLRLLELSNHTLWADEINQIKYMTVPFIEYVRRIPQQQFCSYLSGDYYLIYPFFQIFSYNKWGLAIPHIIVTIIGFYLLYLICRRHLITIWGYIITFSVVCFNTNLINHATEIRVYAVLPTLALGTFYFSQLILDPNIHLSRIKKLAIGAFFILVIWFHIYGILIFLFPIFFSLLTRRGDKPFPKETIKFLIIVLFIAMPLWFYSVLGPHLPYDDNDIFLYIPNPLENILGFLKAIFGNLVGYKKLYFLLVGIVIPFVLPHKERFKQILFLLVMICIPIGAIFLFDILTKYWFLQRQFVWVMPLFAFYLGWSWDSFLYIIFEKKRSKTQS